MANLTRPDDIVVEFLRARLTDPRSRYTSDSDSFTATAGQTEFVLTPTTNTDLVRAITSVTVAGSAKKKWEEFDVDLKDKKITLKTGASVGQTVVVNYYASASGEEWIYPGMPISRMGKEKFPRISVIIVNKTGDRLGPYDSSVNHSSLVQVDVWTKPKYGATIGGEYYAEQNLADYLGYEIEGAFIDNVDDLYPKLYNYVEAAFGQMPFEEDSQTFRHKQEFTLNGVNVGQ